MKSQVKNIRKHGVVKCGKIYTNNKKTINNKKLPVIGSSAVQCYGFYVLKSGGVLKV